MKRFLFALFSALVLVSCAREWAPEEPLQEEGLVERTWTVVVDDGTRATLDESMHPVWEVGEQLTVYDHVAQVGRTFEVKSFDGGKATISGLITAGGDIPFDAVYPSTGAGEWSPGGTNTLNLPDVQVIPSGRNVCPDVLVSTAHSKSPDRGITFHNIVSLLKLNVGRDDIASVDISLASSTDGDVCSYTLAAETGLLPEDTYFVAVNPGTYAGGLSVVCSDGFGTEYRKSSSNSLEAVVGGIKNLGTVSDGTPWYYYDVKADKEYSGQQALLDATGMLDGLSVSQRLLVTLFLSTQFTDRNSPVSAISYTYISADPQGKPVELSAVVYIPKAVLQGTQTLAGIALANHGTIASNAECPTEKAQLEGAFAWKKYAVVMPDYYGFGFSKDRPQAYLDSGTTARGSIDAYLAALQLMADRGITKPDKSLSFGYSQGGFNSMANLKYVTEHPEKGVTFKKVLCGGSPFDVPTTWDAYISGTGFRNAIGFVPMTLVSINESQKLGLSYDRLFKGTLLENWQAWILSKEYTLSQINSRLGTNDLSDILSDEMMEGTGPNFEAVMSVCRRYSLTSGWTPPQASQTKIVIYHSTNDDTVPYGNFTAMKTFLDGSIPGQYTAYDGADGGHVAACISFIQKTIGEW